MKTPNTKTVLAAFAAVAAVTAAAPAAAQTYGRDRDRYEQDRYEQGRYEQDGMARIARTTPVVIIVGEATVGRISTSGKNA